MRRIIAMSTRPLVGFAGVSRLAAPGSVVAKLQLLDLNLRFPNASGNYPNGQGSQSVLCAGIAVLARWKFPCSPIFASLLLDEFFPASLSRESCKRSRGTGVS